MILTILLKSKKLVKKIENEFGVTNYTAKKVKKLVKEKGILSSPDPKPGKMLSEDTINLFKKDYISIKDKESCKTLFKSV